MTSAPSRTTPPGTPASVVVGLLGADIGGSLAAPLQEGEGVAAGIPLAYRLIDATAAGLSLGDAGKVLTWAVRFGFDGLAVTHPFKTEVMAHVDDATPEARALGASNLVTIRAGRLTAHNTDWVGFADALRTSLPEVVNDRMVLLGAGGAGVAVGYGVLRYGATRLTVVDRDRDRAAAVADRLGQLAGRDRVTWAEDVESALAESDGLIQATPVGMTGHEGLPLDPDLLRAGQWVADIVYFPRETELLARARAQGCRVMPGGVMAVHQHAAAFRLLTGRAADVQRMSAHFAELTRAPALPLVRRAG